MNPGDVVKSVSQEFAWTIGKVAETAAS
jgi:hypothetical protein